ncbi:N-glycosyltransferase [Rubripirellula obstinata]|uniref:N-glycosyltransferase n=1 Tax=Rubripirellula obstinata TaxID=406547 RepID=A0A5B1CHQ2_9BACT|nr:glycosyltransferase [Rubripirellula obstinata]KAA1260086.1 N-glycosyltransferase [Rubripirellula obstinata]
MSASSIRYDISTTARLIRAIPIVAGYLFLLILVFVSLPEKAQRIPLESIVVIGFIGIFRYGCVITHCIRALIYEHYMYPKIRFEADQLPAEQKMPKRVYFIIPTAGEKPEVSRKMLSSVLDESASITSQVIIIVNAGSEDDDAIFQSLIAERDALSNVEVRYVRQHGGKRGGMADCMSRLMSESVDDNDVVVLMDGDTVLGDGIMNKCLPLFALKPLLGAVTTDNISVTKGNWMYRKWYTLRFSMRHRMMKSQSLSSQLLVLTGRFSIVRAKEAFTDEFVSYLENDRIKHWLHGEIKFVTGDDKSTWYCLLKRGCQMLYVPDAHIFCMEDSGPKPISMSIKKMHRWFGNMLRNNGRAIRLGMGCQKPFIWWCHLDQRISMFTSLLGPVAAIWAAFWLSPYYLVAYGMLVVLARLAYALILTLEGHRMSFTDIPLLLYTQWVGSIVKIYTMFHLHRQKWDSHRQASTGSGNGESFFDGLIPKMQMAFSFTILLVFVAALVGVK